MLVYHLASDTGSRPEKTWIKGPLDFAMTALLPGKCIVARNTSYKTENVHVGRSI